MSLDTSKIKTLTPSQFITFTIPNPIPHPTARHCYLRSPVLRVALLDSPIVTSDGDVPLIAAMVVPGHRESDWIFSTESGHFQLLFNFSNVSRLVLIGNNPPPNSEPSIYVRPPVTDTVDKEKLEDELKPLVIALHPVECFQNGLPEPVFLTYEDTTLYRVTINRSVGPFVGEFLVEDVEVESNVDCNKDLRRRLRFKRMPNLIQSEIPLIPTVGNVVGNLGLDLPSLRKMNEVKFRVDTGVLIQPYLTAMVSGLFLIVSLLDRRMKQGFIPRALCLGVGGGALLSFLNTRLGFEVVGVEADEVVLSVARQYFGLNDRNSIRLILGDAIELIEKAASRRTKGDTHDLQVNIDCLNAKFDVVMVDLDSSDARTGISAPPPEIVRKPVFQAARSVLHDHGVFVINVVPPDERFYVTLIQELQDVFHKVHEINVENEDNFVLVGTVSPIASNDHDNALSRRLRCAISGASIDSIMEL
ncbi:methyltransferase-like protein 13 [Cynara cardunculus var. scolymus]|uniref:Methyltransferase-like protein 13 n=1 Tax=Cynara cardunculus var. scolymus TaxID=59895 RepID=A0A118K5T6_CYNCS|nr:methyltransferase-like protein 13 [Cynara cardunculus var. scolymus]KVI09600.1 hypothetical protein Ccrd_011970 [Cynara cardunculus var. scolymus]